MTDVDVQIPTDLFFKVCHTKKRNQSVNSRINELILKGLGANGY